jgi:DNA (cytosine-5)-methyltransferase 1
VIVDLCAGPGGWDEECPGALGFEIDRAACATRAAAGHVTVRADIASWPLEPLAGNVGGVIGSPPCTTFSTAGDREGVAHLAALVAHIDGLGDEWRAPEAPGWDPVKTGLVLEPLRWASALRPEWIALEQVPPVLPGWEATARTLRRWGYSAWCGRLSAETFGVPQTRARAILMAHRGRTVQPPPATHQEYEPGVPAREQHGLFGTLLPWVSMAEALGWGATERPMVTMAAGHTRGTVGGGSGGRAIIERERGAWRVDTRGDSGRDQDSFDPATMPARTLTGKTDSWRVSLDRRQNGAPVIEDCAERPAPTLTAAAVGKNVWSLWAYERPATTIVGSFRPDIAAPPTWRGPGDGPRQNQPGAIKLTLRDGLLLQSFRPDYPVQGSKTAQWQQVGNAIPPLMARAILGALR